jgi:hypothetical protein
MLSAALRPIVSPKPLTMEFNIVYFLMVNYKDTKSFDTTKYFPYLCYCEKTCVHIP